MTVYRPVGRTYVSRLEQELEDLFVRYEEFLRDPESPLELRSDLGKYACVRVCGYLEQSLITLARAHIEGQSSPTAARFGVSWLARMQNPRREILVEFARRFQHAWGDELDAYFDEIDPTTTFNSLVQTRNDIAHGLSTGIGHDTLVGYFRLVVDVVAWFADRLEPQP